MKKGLLIITLFIISIVLMIISYDPTDYKYYNEGLLYINEVMPSNSKTISYMNESPDYIELYNGYDYDINLKGYHLSDVDDYNLKWEFPEVTIRAGEYLLVYASDKNKCEEYCETNFKLSSNGGVVVLSDDKGKVLSKIKYKNTEEDVSYGYNGSEYVYYYVGTPLDKNNEEYSNEPIVRGNSNIKVRINEYTNNNISLIKDKKGNYYSVVELYNYGVNDVNLDDCFLSDKASDVMKYKLPNVTIKANDYLLIYLSGKDVYENNEVHANFELSKNDQVLVLSSKRQELISKMKVERLLPNMVALNTGEEVVYSYNATFGKENSNETQSFITTGNNEAGVVINEVTNTAIELKNVTDKDIDLKNYRIKGNNNYIMTFPSVTIKAGKFLVIYESSKYSYSNGKIYTGFKINSKSETITLYNSDNNVIDTFYSGKIIGNMSYGLNSAKETVIYKTKSMGSENSNTYYLGYAEKPTFSSNNMYVEKGAKISLSTSDSSTIYYTLDGSFPTTNSKKYTDEITINKNTVVKAISVKDGFVNSDIESRTYIVAKKHDIPIVSISAPSSSFFGYNGIFTKYYSEIENRISFEFYESDGSLGTSFIGGAAIAGADSSKQPQKSVAVYLRSEYGTSDVTYPFFKDGETLTYSSFTLRNSGEDPKNIRIMDTALTYALKGQMDIDMQDYRPVAVYVNGEYYGLYNMRERLNADYVESKYGVSKDEIDFIKYGVVKNGSLYNYNQLVSYIRSHDCSRKDVYEYIKTQLDVQELCNYWIVQSYYGNTDLANIRYWKSKNGKWRFMLYDLDWSLWSSSLSMSFPVKYIKIHAVTYLSSSIDITRRLYANSEFRDLYLSTLAYHLKNTFNPKRMNGIVDELVKEVETEMPNHIARWGSSYPGLANMSMWRSNLGEFKSMLTKRYNNVVGRLRSDFGLSNSEYQKYFKDL